jgi:ATP-dependent RNA helicase DeaD
VQQVLEKPETVSTEAVNQQPIKGQPVFTDYSLPEHVLQAIVRKGFVTPTAIQAEALPHALKGKDVLGQARTGTGKTLAFGLPIASRLKEDYTRGRAPRALILTPTRELALQVAGELVWVAPHLEIVTIYGGTGYGLQAGSLKRGCDVVVATPGRAIDYLEKRILSLHNVEIAVLDEADEMLSMGFEEDVETLLAATAKERQTLLFSATLPNWAKKLASEHLIDPVHINLIKNEEVTYEEIAIEAPLKNRAGILSDILHAHQGEKAIIFTHTKAETDELAKQLTMSGHAAEAINGDLNQVQRERVIAKFRTGQVGVLIGTNVAARGLDIPEVDLVIHYRIPSESESYQHRSGRTGRAGRKGTVVLLYGPKEIRELALLERTVSRRFKRSSAPTAQEVQDVKLTNLLANAKSQSKENKSFWQETAKEIVSKGDSDTLAGLLAMLLGGAPVARSLLTGDEGWVTLRLEGNLQNVAQVVRRVKEAGIGELGRIQVTNEAAYVDVLPEEADGLVVEGIKVSRAKTAPSMPPERSDRDRAPRDRGFNRGSETRSSESRGFRGRSSGGQRRDSRGSSSSQKRRGQDSRY